MRNSLSFKKCDVLNLVDDDDVHYYNCQRLKLEGETENRWDEGVDEMRERYVRLEEREG